MCTPCPWARGSSLLEAYHNEAWGVPVHDDHLHFEMLVLETMQAGLSWLVVLKKREHYRRICDSFDPHRIALYGEDTIKEMMESPELIRNRRKLAAMVTNAKAFLRVQREFGSFDRYIWGWTGGRVIDHRLASQDEMPVTNRLSDALSRDMKRRGFSFVGSITLYSHLQAIGVIQDHLTSCFRYREITSAAGYPQRVEDNHSSTPQPPTPQGPHTSSAPPGE